MYANRYSAVFVLFRFRRLCAGALRERVNTTRTSIAGKDLSGDVGSGRVTEKKRSPLDKKEEEKMNVNDSGSATVGETVKYVKGSL